MRHRYRDVNILHDFLMADLKPNQEGTCNCDPHIAYSPKVLLNQLLDTDHAMEDKETPSHGCYPNREHFLGLPQSVIVNYTMIARFHVIINPTEQTFVLLHLFAFRMRRLSRRVFPRECLLF